MALFKRMTDNKTMEILLWNKIDPIFDGLLDDIYRTTDYCHVCYVVDKGFCVLNYSPQYSLYQRLGIPEIQDIFVLPDARRQGVATTLIQYCEGLCDKDAIGISVPVGADYGPAQSLYAQCGYIPDGNGVTYNREFVPNNTTVKIDDNLCLMLIKNLG
jgi:GNAT superfamily N-acetyltransferase